MPEQVKPCQKVRLVPDLWDEIDKRAAIEERSRNKMIELLIRRGLKVTYIECELSNDVKIEKTNKASFGGISYDPNKIKI